jgi:uncharacterized damage-inducible protein DinB
MNNTQNPGVPGASELLARQFRFARDSTITLLHEFDEETARWRPTPHNNNVLWLAGHLLISNDEMRESLGFPPREDGPEIDQDFSMGGFFKEEKEYPSFIEFANALIDLIEAIKKMTAEDLAKPTEGPLAELCPTHADLVSLIVAHENIHNGQMYFLRRGLGREPLIK